MCCMCESKWISLKYWNGVLFIGIKVEKLYFFLLYKIIYVVCIIYYVYKYGFYLECICIDIINFFLKGWKYDLVVIV